MKIALVLMLVLLTSVVFAEKVNVFECGFETGDGYSTGALTGQCGWTEYFNNTVNLYEVTEDVSYSGDQSLYVYGPRSGGDTGAKKTITYQNPYQADTIFTYMLKPSAKYCRVYVYDSNDREIIVIHINTYELYVDAGGTWSGGDPNLSADQWYQVTAVIDPKKNIVKDFTLGEVRSIDGPRAYANGSASGDIGSLVIRTGWNDASDSYVDDISIDLVPEPASIGLLALAGLFLLRKRS